MTKTTECNAPDPHLQGAVTLKDLPVGVDDLGLPYLGERCKTARCRGRRLVVGYSVDDATWEAVVGKDGPHIVCIACFDEMAQIRGVSYEAFLLDTLRIEKTYNSATHVGKNEEEKP